MEETKDLDTIASIMLFYDFFFNAHIQIDNTEAMTVLRTGLPTPQDMACSGPK